MKYPMWALLLSVVCVGVPAARAQDSGGPLLAEVELKLQDAGTDDQLIELARAAKINVMADASDLPDAGPQANAAASAAMTVTQKQPTLDWLRDMAFANRLTWQRNGGNTIVLWPKADSVSLARRVVDEAVAQRPQLVAEIKPALQAALDPALLARLKAEPEKWSQVQDRFVLYRIVVDDSLRTLLQKQHGWDGQNQDFRLQLTNDQIPTDLRSQLIVLRHLMQTQPDQVAPRAWLSHEIWQKARFVVQQTAPTIINGKMQRSWLLNVIAPLNGQEARHLVAVLIEQGGEDQ